MSEPGILPEPVPFGKYYLLERINVGGMAEVFKAKAFGVEGFERLLAIKQILANIAKDESFINMFIDEAKIAGQLSHPNIAQIFDLGQADGSYFIALEYISGKDLKTIFERARRIGEKVSIPRICYLVMKICEGLGYAHEKKDPQGNDLNIVHRDVSPQNVLLSYEGEVKIIDFGIAKAQGKTSQTQAGMLKGKFSYMSPEQVRGIHVDHRSDIFSLGIVLYELLTLERLFLGESDFEIMRKIRHVEMSPPSLYNPHVPKELEDIVLKALAGNSGERYQSAYELAEDLEQFMRSQGYYYTNKDLASYMKEAFQADIDFENKKLEYYRTLNLQPITQQNGASPAGGGLSWGDEEMETQIFGRDDEEFEESITESDIVYAEDVNPSNGVSDHDVTQIHVPGATPPDDDDPTMEFDRWSADIDLGRRKKQDSRNDDLDLDIDIELEPRRSISPTAEMPAVERRAAPQHTVPSAPVYAGPEPRKKKKTRLSIVALVALLVIGIGVGGYYYMNLETTSAVTFDFGEEHVQISVNGEVIHDGVTPLEVELPAGQTHIVVERDGHHPFESNENLVAGQPFAIQAELEPFDYANTGFDLTTTPEAATLFVDGEEAEETTPASIRELEPGVYTLRVELEDFFEFEEEVEITFDQVADLNWELRPTTVDLEITSSVDRATYSVFAVDNDESIGQGRTPDTLTGLDASRTYRVVVERRGHESWEQTFEPGLQREVTLLAELEAEPEPVAAATSGDRATATDASRGGTSQTSSSRDRERELEQERRERAREREREREAAAAAAAAAEPDPVVPDPPARGTGTLSVASRPAARVFINDRDTGRYTPLVDFELPAGTHRVVLVNEEFDLDKTYYVEIEAGGQERIINR